MRIAAAVELKPEQRQALERIARGPMSYDLDGNTLNDGTNTYVWDARNHLISANNSGAAFTYDGLGRRVSKTLLSTNTNFVYDGLNPVQELSGSSPSANLLTGYIDERFVRTDANGSLDYLTDGLGSTMALTSPAEALQVGYSYDPYGGMTISGSSSNSYGYTGREFDGLGIDYYRARYYDPPTGRFLSEDPLGFGGGDVNLYTYALGSPTNFFDPTGLDYATSVAGAFQAAGGIAEAAAGIGFGAATSWTGIGALAGGAVALHGLDEAQAGFRQMLSGCHVNSFTSRGLQSAGLSPFAANLVDTGISVAGSLGTGIGAQAIRAGGIQNIFYYEAGQSTMSASEFARYGQIEDPVARGMQRVADQGWPSALGSGARSIDQFGNTVGQGLTPFATGGLGAVGRVVGALAGHSCGCNP